MRLFNYAAALLAVSVLVGCGGGGNGDQSPKIKFTSQVSFGDSLSDVGSYAVSTITAYGGGGQYTINGTGKNWTELMAAQFDLTVPCAYQTGLNGSVFGSGVVAATNASCTSYAQGGARVTNPVGPGNVGLGGADAMLGQLTVPITTQVDNHLAAVGGSFSGNEVVFVLAGANDVFIQLATYAAMVGAGTPSATAATTVATDMATAGTELAGYINNKIIANGANYVVVINMPDVSSTPLGTEQEAAAPGSKALINTLVTSFNAKLQSGLAGSNAKVLFIDAYTANRDQISNPAIYGLTNTTTPACDLAAVTNPIASALMCNANNLIPGVVDHYMFADKVHPTPYSHWLLARLVSKEMIVKGWL